MRLKKMKGFFFFFCCCCCCCCLLWSPGATEGENANKSKFSASAWPDKSQQPFHVVAAPPAPKRSLILLRHIEWLKIFLPGFKQNQKKNSHF